MNRNQTNRRGFTLVEQMVAIASTAVVAAVIVPGVLGQLDKAEIGRMLSDIQNVEKAAKTFRTDIGYWPGSIVQLKESLESLVSTNADVTTLPEDAYGDDILQSVHDQWAGPYFDPKSFTAVAAVGGGTVTALPSAAGTYFTTDLDAATIANSTLTSATAGTDSTTFFALDLNNVSESAAEKLNFSIDGDNLESNADAFTTGRVRWVASDGSTSKGTLTYLAGPIN